MSNHFFISTNGYVSLYCEVVDRLGCTVNAHVINGAWGFKINIAHREMWWYSPTGFNCRSDVEVMWLHRKPFDDYNEAIDWAQRRVEMSAPRRWACEQGDRIAFNWSAYTSRLRRTIRAAKLAWDGAPAKPVVDEDDWPL